jgi:hypothetical protein
MGRFSSLIMYLRPAISNPIDPRTEAINAAISDGAITGLCRNARMKDSAS